MDYVRWLDKKPSCVICHQMWAKKDEEPPCRACAVILEDDNVDVAKVFLAVRHHVVIHEVEDGKAYQDLDIRAIHDALDIYNVRDREKCYERVRQLFFQLGKEPE